MFRFFRYSAQEEELSLYHGYSFSRARFLASGATVTGGGVRQHRYILGIEFQALVGTFIHANAAPGTFLPVNLWFFCQSSSPPFLKNPAGEKLKQTRAPCSHKRVSGIKNVSGCSRNRRNHCHQEHRLRCYSCHPGRSRNRLRRPARGP